MIGKANFIELNFGQYYAHQPQHRIDRQIQRQSQRLYSSQPRRRDSGISQLDENQAGDRRSGLRFHRRFFSRDGTIPEDGLRIVVENFRKSMSISRAVALMEVSDAGLLFEVQRELGIKK